MTEQAINTGCRRRVNRREPAGRLYLFTKPTLAALPARAFVDKREPIFEGR